MTRLDLPRRERRVGKHQRLQQAGEDSFYIAAPNTLMTPGGWENGKRGDISVPSPTPCGLSVSCTQTSKRKVHPLGCPTFAACRACEGAKHWVEHYAPDTTRHVGES